MLIIALNLTINRFFKVIIKNLKTSINSIKNMWVNCIICWSSLSIIHINKLKILKFIIKNKQSLAYYKTNKYKNKRLF